MKVDIKSEYVMKAKIETDDRQKTKQKETKSKAKYLRMLT